MEQTMNAEPSIRVMVVSDQAIVRAGLASVLDECWDIAVVANIDHEALPDQLLPFAEPAIDVALIVDPLRPGIGGLTAIRHLRDAWPDVRVVVMTDSVHDASLHSMIRAGASACLLLTANERQLAHAIRDVVAGQSTFPAGLLPDLRSVRDEQLAASTLTAREGDVLALLADGQTNKLIAVTLGLTEGTVRGYVGTILTKLGVTNRTEAAILAIRQGLVDQRLPVSTLPTH
jgi:DNA-binding NarL/FixJ family response regulator